MKLSSTVGFLLAGCCSAAITLPPPQPRGPYTLHISESENDTFTGQSLFACHGGGMYGLCITSPSALDRMPAPSLFYFTKISNLNILGGHHAGYLSSNLVALDCDESNYSLAQPKFSVKGNTGKAPRKRHVNDELKMRGLGDQLVPHILMLDVMDGDMYAASFDVGPIYDVIGFNGYGEMFATESLAMFLLDTPVPMNSRIEVPSYNWYICKVSVGPYYYGALTWLDPEGDAYPGCSRVTIERRFEP